jgi:hypothetical protein
METRRRFELAAAFTTALVLGVLIGYGAARSTSPESRYMVGPWSVNKDQSDWLYCCDTYTGRTWWWSFSSKKWHEIPQPDQVVSPHND